MGGWRKRKIAGIISNFELARALPRRGKLSTEDWACLLKNCPQFMEKAKEFASGWAAILASRPELASECGMWEKFRSKDWCYLLSAQPQFEGECTRLRKWRNFRPNIWLPLLKKQPQFAPKCKKWDKFSPYDWLSLLSEQPQFADKFAAWENFSFEDLRMLLKRQPPLADKAKECASAKVLCKFFLERPDFADNFNRWQEFDAGSWLELLQRHPHLVGKAREYVKGWAAILKLCPELAGEFDGWKNFSPYDWRGVLRSQPQFIDRAKEFAAGWAAILSLHPELVPECPMQVKFSEKQRNFILKRQPKLAEKLQKGTSMKNWTEYNLNGYDTLWVLCAIWIYKTHKRKNSRFIFSRQDIEWIAGQYNTATPPANYFTQNCAVGAPRNQERNYIIIMERNSFMLAYEGYKNLRHTTLENVSDLFLDDFCFECEGENVSMRELRAFINFTYKNIVQGALEGARENNGGSPEAPLKSRLEKIENSIEELRALLLEIRGKIGG